MTAETPGRHDSYSGSHFSGVSDAIFDGDERRAQLQLGRLCDAVEAAARALLKG